jgi:hypothetical protein
VFGVEFLASGLGVYRLSADSDFSQRLLAEGVRVQRESV